MTDYRFGNLQITDEEDYIDKSDNSLVSWFERIPYVYAATPRLESSAAINITKFGERIEETRVAVVGIDPLRDIKASKAHETVTEGQYVFSRNSIVIGSNVAEDLGGAQVGDNVKLKIVDRYGKDQLKRFIVTGIATSPGGNGFDYSVVIHIDTLRDLMDRDGYTGSIMVKLDDPSKSSELKRSLLTNFSKSRFQSSNTRRSS